VKRANIKIEKNQLMSDVNIRLATPLPSEMSAINIENREEEND
jgi:hypothetical protein